jgi:hypothetical protein
MAQRALDAVDGIAGDGVSFAELVEQRGARGKFAPDAGVGELASFAVLAPGDHVRPGNGPELGLPAAIMPTELS